MDLTEGSPRIVSVTPGTTPHRGVRAAVVSALDDRPLLLLFLGTVMFSVGPLLIAVSDTSGARERTMATSRSRSGWSIQW